MKILVAGFDRSTTEALTQRFRDDGHHALGASGSSATQTLVRAAHPDQVVLPDGDRGEEVTEWLDDLGYAGHRRVLPLADVPALVDEASVLAPPASQTKDEDKSDSAKVVVAPQAQEVGVDAPSQAVALSSARRDVSLREGVASALSASRELPDLAMKLRQVRFADYYEVLELSANDADYQVAENFQRLCRDFQPEGWPARLSEEQLAQLVEVGRGIRDAYSILGDPELRRRYEKAQRDPSRRA